MVSFCKQSTTKSSPTLTRSVQIQPRARKSEVIGVHDGRLKVKVSAPPVDGAANEELIKVFAKLLSVPKSKIEILSGEKSKQKVIQVKGLTLSQFTQILIQHGLLTVQFG